MLNKKGFSLMSIKKKFFYKMCENIKRFLQKSNKNFFVIKKAKKNFYNKKSKFFFIII